MARQDVMPPFAYYGGKTTLAPRIAELLPKHDHYIEPFAGSLAVLLAKSPSKWETVNDLDCDIITFWRVLRDDPDGLERAAALTPHSRGEWFASRAGVSDAPSDLERARRVWVVLTQSRGNSMVGNGWRYRTDATSGGTSMPATLGSYVSRITPAAERLRSVTLESRDAVDVIRDYGTDASSCIYADPPYLGSTRTTGYRHELKADSEHRTLADALNGCKASVVLSGYDSPLYAELFPGWHRIDIKAPTALSGANDRVEVLWSNRPLGEPDLFAGLPA